MVLGQPLPAKYGKVLLIGMMIIIGLILLYGLFSKIVIDDWEKERLDEDVEYKDDIYNIQKYVWEALFIFIISFPLLIIYSVYHVRRRKKGLEIRPLGIGGWYFISCITAATLVLALNIFLSGFSDTIGRGWKLILCTLIYILSIVLLILPFGIPAGGERRIVDYFMNNLKWEYYIVHIKWDTHISKKRIKKYIRKCLKKGWMSGKVDNDLFFRTDLEDLRGERREELIRKAHRSKKESRLEDAFDIYMMLGMTDSATKTGNRLIRKAIKDRNEEKAIKVGLTIKERKEAEELAYDLIERVLDRGEVGNAVALCELMGYLDLREEILRKDNRQKTGAETSQKPSEPEEDAPEEEPSHPKSDEKDTITEKEKTDRGVDKGTSHEKGRVDLSDIFNGLGEPIDDIPPPPPEDYTDVLSVVEGVPASPSVRKFIPDYTITHKIGSGGFAIVYKARDKENDKIVAIKLPKFLDETLDASVYKKFKAEANMWKKLKHKNIVKIYNSNIEPIPHIVMELMEGGDLKHLLSKHRFSVQESMEIMLQVSSGMAYAHRMASVHRDIKPENILFTLDGIPKITDWGIGKYMASEGASNTTGTKGTLKHSAPEQISRKKFGKIDWQTDIFQLGILFYELLTGKNPFMDDDPAGIIGKILHEEVLPPSSINQAISPPLDRLILKCLSKEKEGRWVSADVLFSQLKRLNEQKQSNLKKYRRYLARALSDGRITEDEGELLSEIREELNITKEDHEILHREIIDEKENHTNPKKKT